MAPFHTGMQCTNADCTHAAQGLLPATDKWESTKRTGPITFTALI